MEQQQEQKELVKGAFIAQHRRCIPGKEAEYNRWYNEQHIPDVLQGALDDLGSRRDTPDMVMSDAIDLKNAGAFIFTPVAEKVTAKDVARPRRAA